MFLLGIYYLTYEELRQSDPLVQLVPTERFVEIIRIDFNAGSCYTKSQELESALFILAAG